MKVTRFCPAKINLFLEVTGKLPSGYHELATLFAKINLGDTLSVDACSAPDTRITLALTGPVGKFLQADQTNLVWRAAQAFLDYFNMHAHIALALDKHTPTGAGLGGGSSDAAGVLLALCEIFGKDKNELLAVAAKLGADVPLFMYEDTFLKGEGIGEKLTPIPYRGKLPFIVLIYPHLPVPTKGVFARLKLPNREEVLTRLSQLNKIILNLEQGAPLPLYKQLLFNRLEESVVPFECAIREVLTDLANTGTEVYRMSGSGSTLFALVENEHQVQDLVAALSRPERDIYVTKFLESKHANNGNQNTSDE
jgi:4-diphosphocytidyl-2-C-methyl-D-erythritol kinase